MQLNLVSRNGLSLASDVAVSRTIDRWRDVWDTDAYTRAIVDPSGARMTFTYNGQSHTVVQFPAGGRVTLAWCQSQMTSAPATLSQFGAQIALRLNQIPLRSKSTLDSTNAPVGTFLAHPESQRQVASAARRALHTTSKRRRWLDDVVQLANLKLLTDLRRGKLIFRGDDPERFVRWFRGASRHAVADAIKFCVRAFGGSGLAAAPGEVPNPNAADIAESVILRDLGRQAVDEIERIPEVILRQIMRDLRDGKSTLDSAARLGISKSQAARMRKRGCQLLAERLGQ